jgi:exonuclease VII large subunit
MMICSQHPTCLFPHAFTPGEDCLGPGVDAWGWIRRVEREIASLQAENARLTDATICDVCAGSDVPPPSLCACEGTHQAWKVLENVRKENCRLAVQVEKVTRERDEARRGADLLQQFSHELGEALQLRGDGTLTLSQAVMEKFTEVRRKWESLAHKIRVESAHIGDPCIYCRLPMDDVPVGQCPGTREVLRTERDAALARVAELEARTVHCEHCGGDYTQTGLEVGCACQLTEQLATMTQERDAALARVQAVVEAASLVCKCRTQQAGTLSMALSMAIRYLSTSLDAMEGRGK